MSMRLKTIDMVSRGDVRLGVRQPGWLRSSQITKSLTARLLRRRNSARDHEQPCF